MSWRCSLWGHTFIIVVLWILSIFWSRRLYLDSPWMLQPTSSHRNEHTARNVVTSWNSRKLKVLLASVPRPICLSWVSHLGVGYVHTLFLGQANRSTTRTHSQVCDSNPTVSECIQLTGFDPHNSQCTWRDPRTLDWHLWTSYYVKSLCSYHLVAWISAPQCLFADLDVLSDLLKLQPVCSILGTDSVVESLSRV